MNYTLGIDFGTLSCRTVLVSEGGELIQTAVMDYPHGCMDGENNAVFQDPRDYLLCLQTTVRQAARGYEAQIRSLCVDFTACTCLPVDASLQPLAPAKLWKSHSATDQAQRITDLCRELGMDLSPYGGTVSCEWLIPKLLETKETDPALYEKTAYWLEAADWLTWLLTGKQLRSTCFGGFKGLCSGGWPERLLEKLELRRELFAGDFLPPGAFAGCLNSYGASLLGLPQTVRVCAPVIDAHAALPAAGLKGDGEVMLILGTSGCYLAQSRKNATVPGLFGKVLDGVLPGYYIYEGGQGTLGDLFGWFMENAVPHSYYEAAKGDVFAYLEGLAASITDNPVWAIDWWNGSRSPYLDPTLTGSLFGLSLRTRPEHIYRALLEAAAFCTRQILERMEDSGLPVRRIHVGGGIPGKNRLYMQILADVLGRDLLVCAKEPASAMGAAVLAAWGGGLYATPEEAISAMESPVTTVFSPSGADYSAAYRRYCQTADRMAK